MQGPGQSRCRTAVMYDAGSIFTRGCHPSIPGVSSERAQVRFGQGCAWVSRRHAGSGQNVPTISTCVRSPARGYDQPSCGIPTALYGTLKHTFGPVFHIKLDPNRSEIWRQEWRVVRSIYIDYIYIYRQVNVKRDTKLSLTYVPAPPPASAESSRCGRDPCRSQPRTGTPCPIPVRL